MTQIADAPARSTPETPVPPLAPPTRLESSASAPHALAVLPDRPSTAQREDRSRRTAELFAELARTTDPRRRVELEELVVLANVGVAQALARRFAGRDLDEQDLCQVAYEGLVKAVHRFDPGRDLDFLSFAVPTMRGELQRHFRDHGWTVRPTRRVQENQWRISRTESDLAQDLGRPPTRQEVMTALELTPEDYAAATTGAQGCFRPTSLDQPVGTDPAHARQTTLGELFPAGGEDLPAVEARVMLAPVVRRLSSRDKQVVYLRYFAGLTQREIGEEIGVTQTQVSRILGQILDTLREGLGDDASDERRDDARPSLMPLTPLSA